VGKWRTRERLLLGSFSILAVAPFAYAATKSSFWQTDTAPVTAVLYFAVVFGLVVGRYRWAWFLLFVLDGAVQASWLVHPPNDLKKIVFALIGFAALILLLSPAMRARLRHPVPFRLRRA
jgi:O-antigen ligase